LARYFFAGLRRGLLIGLLSCKARVRAPDIGMVEAAPDDDDDDEGEEA
jgi:hypothetical protein